MTSDGTVEVTYPESSSGARLLMGTLTFKPRNKPDIGDIGYFLVVEEGKVMHLSQSRGDLGWASRKPNPSPSSWLLPWTAGLVNCYNLALLGTKSKRNEGEFLTHSLPVVLSTTYPAIGRPSEAKKKAIATGCDGQRKGLWEVRDIKWTVGCLWKVILAEAGKRPLKLGAHSAVSGALDWGQVCSQIGCTGPQKPTGL